MNVFVYLASILIPWVLRTVLYHYGFRWKHINATIQTKIIVAAATMLANGLVPIPLPGILRFLLGAGLALYLCRKFTDGKLFPDLILIVGGIEIISMVFVNELLLPIL